MKVLKNILSFILAIIITILICLIFATNLLNTTVLSKNYFLSKLNEADYYNQVYVFTESNFEKYINQSGLDEEVIKNLITVDMIKADTEKIIRNIYENTQESIDIEIVEKNLRNNIESYLNQNNLTADPTDIEDFVQTIGNEYLICLSHNKYEQKIYDTITKISKLAKKVNKISIIALAMSILLLVGINIRTIYNSFANFGVSLFSSGLILMFINIYVNKKIDVKNLVVMNDSLSFALRKMAFGIFDDIFGNAIILMMSGLALIVVSLFVHNCLEKPKDEKIKS